ncbi:DsbA family protein [Stakelama sp. CBK3Z-3]|uniref:DsbA family protein n=1 Tax=Stakelama flava TaxID=2860338 RepID=A0ABS6XIZ7_9SPHN|nr:thioredoxin domain-containing protein [Stakelama flava]MBW4330183.1 DsbA family protein [Stakelama flava]
MRLFFAALAALLVSPALSQGHPVTPMAVSQEGADLVFGAASAPVTLDEYLSYTCPHCAHFAEEADDAIEAMAASGTLRVRLIPAVRDPLDVAEAMLVRCAPPDLALSLHRAFFARQEELYNAARRDPAFYTRVPELTGKDIAAVVAATPLPAIVEQAGMDKAALAACTVNGAALARLTTNAKQVWTKIEGTPSFAVNGALLDVNDWPSVQARIAAAQDSK